MPYSTSPVPTNMLSWADTPELHSAASLIAQDANMSKQEAYGTFIRYGLELYHLVEDVLEHIRRQRIEEAEAIAADGGKEAWRKSRESRTIQAIFKPSDMEAIIWIRKAVAEEFGKAQ